MRTFPGQIEFAWSWTLCPPTQPARWITPSRLAKREGGKLIFGPPYGIIQHPSAAFGPRANFLLKRSFPQNFRSAPPIPAENRPNGEEVA
jgi:hypothetical protein